MLSKLNLNPKTLAILAALAAALIAYFWLRKCCETFDARPIGTTFNVPGVPIFTFCRTIQVKIDRLKSGSFNFAKVEAAPAVFGSRNVLAINNALIEFFPKSPVSEVSFDFLDQGGTENLVVNGIPFVGELAAAPPTLGGVLVSVTVIPVPPNQKGTVVLRKAKSNINSFAVGGQEFFLDNVCIKK